MINFTVLLLIRQHNHTFIVHFKLSCSPVRIILVGCNSIQYNWSMLDIRMAEELYIMTVSHTHLLLGWFLYCFEILIWKRVKR